ncbi:VgrG-related protein [Streptomyces sp. NPDC001339]|uniref:VgrG-related protein n=1 Tax=Streptomyces sp. NPDC001339 TaxID=3364563 RepID=UPI0036C895CD
MGRVAGGRPLAAEPVISTTGPLPAQWSTAFVDGFVDHTINQPAEAVLRFADPQHRMLTDTRITLGTPLQVAVVTSTDRKRTLLFDGEVIGLETESDPAGVYTVLRGMDRGHRLLRGRRAITYPKTTVREVVAKLARRAGLKPGRVDPTHRYEYLCQPGVSDWDFLLMLARDHGGAVTVQGNRLSLRALPKATEAPASSTPSGQSEQVLEYGRNLLSLRAAVDAAEQPASVEVRSWDMTTKKPIVASAKTTNSAQWAPDRPPWSGSAATSGEPPLVIDDRPYRSHAEAVDAAASAAATVAMSRADLVAVAYGSPKLHAGTAVALSGVGEPFTGRYTVTSCRHLFDPGQGYRTRVTLSVAGQAWARDLHRTTRMNGLAIGTVSQVRTPPGAQGRGWVRVRFPWLSDTYVTDWIRAVEWGGKGGGGAFCPGVGDEVLVGFEHGRLDRPYLLGGLYNGQDKPSTTKTVVTEGGTVIRRFLADRSGDRIELVDSGEGAGVLLTTGDGNLSVQLDRGKGAITISGSGLVHLKTTGGLVLDAKTLELKGTGTVKLSGESVELAAGASKISVSAGSIGLKATRVDVT